MEQILSIIPAPWTERWDLDDLYRLHGTCQRACGAGGVSGFWPDTARLLQPLVPGRLPGHRPGRAGVDAARGLAAPGLELFRAGMARPGRGVSGLRYRAQPSRPGGPPAGGRPRQLRADLPHAARRHGGGRRLGARLPGRHGAVRAGVGRPGQGPKGQALPGDHHRPAARPGRGDHGRPRPGGRARVPAQRTRLHRLRRRPDPALLGEAAPGQPAPSARLPPRPAGAELAMPGHADHMPIVEDPVVANPPSSSDWDEINYWRAQLRQAGSSRTERTAVATAWVRAAAGIVLTSGQLDLPDDLRSCLARSELRELARGLGLAATAPPPRRGRSFG